MADLFFFFFCLFFFLFSISALGKTHAYQHVQYGNQNYLNHRSQSYKSTCAVVNNPPH